MNRGGYSYYPATPPRTPAKTTSSPRSSLGGSPPRKVATEFAAFGAPKEASVFGTAVARSPFSLAGGKAAFGGMRNAGVRPTFDDDDDEDEDGMRVGGGGVIPDDDDDGRQKIELRESSISLEQVSGRACRPNATLTSSLGAPDRDAKCVARYEGVMAGSPCA